jgi:hypothetical protein
MDRFTEQQYGTGYTSYQKHIWGDDDVDPRLAAVNECDNCLGNCVTLFPVYKLDGETVEFMACEQCWQEANEIQAKEAASAAMYRKAGLSETEAAAFEKFVNGRVA